MCPPETVKHKNGNFGVGFPSSIKCARICACKWLIVIRGIFIPMANDFAKELPTKREPKRPGPFVKAIASISSFWILAFFIAESTTGIIFC